MVKKRNRKLRDGIPDKAVEGVVRGASMRAKQIQANRPPPPEPKAEQKRYTATNGSLSVTLATGEVIDFDPAGGSSYSVGALASVADNGVLTINQIMSGSALVAAMRTPLLEGLVARAQNWPSVAERIARASQPTEPTAAQVREQEHRVRRRDYEQNFREGLTRELEALCRPLTGYRAHTDTHEFDVGDGQRARLSTGIRQFHAEFVAEGGQRHAMPSAATALVARTFTGLGLDRTIEYTLQEEPQAQFLSLKIITFSHEAYILILYSCPSRLWIAAHDVTGSFLRRDWGQSLGGEPFNPARWESAAMRVLGRIRERL